MDNKSNGFVLTGVVVAVLLSVVAIGASLSRSSAPADPSNVGGQRAGLQEFVDGIKPGTLTIVTESVAIGSGENQKSWYNDTGRTVFVTNPEIGFTSGTASSSYAYYAGSATTSTALDYARPWFNGYAIDGATSPTSTVPTFGALVFSATSTSAGTSTIPVAAGNYFTFVVQERYGCKADSALCATATSTGRGITGLFGYFQYHY